MPLSKKYFFFLPSFLSFLPSFLLFLPSFLSFLPSFFYFLQFLFHNLAFFSDKFNFLLYFLYIQFLFFFLNILSILIDCLNRCCLIVVLVMWKGFLNDCHSAKIENEVDVSVLIETKGLFILLVYNF